MRYRIRVVRAQVAERTVRAADEDEAVQKVQDELAQPYAFLGGWNTMGVEIEVVGAEATPGSTAQSADGGPLLLSVQEAAKHFGVSRGLMYDLINKGEIESLRLGRRRFVSRDAINRFIENNSRAGR